MMLNAAVSSSNRVVFISIRWGWWDWFDELLQIHFKEIVEDARAVIMVGGTMQPVCLKLDAFPNQWHCLRGVIHLIFVSISIADVVYPATVVVWCACVKDFDTELWTCDSFFSFTCWFLLNRLCWFSDIIGLQNCLLHGMYIQVERRQIEFIDNLVVSVSKGPTGRQLRLTFQNRTRIDMVKTWIMEY